MGRNHRARWSAIGAAVAVSIGAGGLITFANAAGGSASTFTPITPCRLLDTRADGPATGETPPRTTPLGAGESLTVTARGNFGNCLALSATATGAVLNVTTVNATANSYLTVWPADKDQPLASNLNWGPGQGPTPNQVTTGLDSSGKLKLFNSAGKVDVIVDVVGLYEPASAGGGPAGPAGANGAKGDKGDQGATGAAGAAGAKGDQGATGAAGAKGDQGLTGAAGAAGAKGDKGDKGDPGLQGLQGIPGPAGGPQGDKGDQGDQGLQGIAGTQLMTSSNPDLSSSNGAYSSMRLDSLGNPVISQYDPGSGDLRLTRCYDPGCVVARSNVVDDGGIGGADVGMYTSLRLDSNDFPVISYYDMSNGDLKLAHCNDVDCAGGDDAPAGAVDSANDVGQYTSLALDSYERPVISYYDVTAGRLRLADCNDVDCAGDDDAPSGSVVTGDVGDFGLYSSMALDPFDQNPTIAYYNLTDGDLKVVHCGTEDCAGTESGVLVDGATTDAGASLSMTLDLGSRPMISYYDADNSSLNIALCDDSACAAPAIASPLGGLPGPIDTSIGMDPLSEVAVVSYIDYTGLDVVMRILRCLDTVCSDWMSSTPDPLPGEVPINTSMVLDFSGNPTIARFDSYASRLTVTHCIDPLCIPHVRVLSAP